MPTLPPSNVVVEPIVPGHCSTVFISWDRPADDKGPTDIVGGGSYSGGIKTVSVVPGKGYHFAKGANETSLVNGTETWTTSIYFYAQGTTVTLNGAGAVTAAIKAMNVQTYRVYRDKSILFEFPSIELPGHIPLGDPNRTELTFYTYRVDAIAPDGSISPSPLAVAFTPECTPTGYPVQFGSMAGDSSLAGATDASGNVFVTGSLLSGLARLMYVAKFNSSAALVWAKYFPSELAANAQNSPAITGCVTDAAGNVFIIGQFNGRLDLGDGWINGTNGRFLETFFAKFNSSGVLQFAKVKSPAQFRGDYAPRIALNGGNIFICGNTQSQFGGLQSFLEKYNSSGILQWTRTFPTVGTANGPVLAVNAAGDIFLTGNTLGGFDVGCGAVVAQGTWIWLAKCSGMDGSCIWSKAYGPTNGFGFGIDGRYIALDSGEDIIIAGLYAAYGGNAGGSDFPTGDFFGSPFVAKYSAVDGTHIWSKGLPTTSQSGAVPHALAIGANDAVFMGGFRGGGFYQFGGQTVTNGVSTGFVAKYSAAGAEVSINTTYGLDVLGFGLLSSDRMAVIGRTETPTRLMDLFVEVVNQ